MEDVYDRWNRSYRDTRGPRALALSLWVALAFASAACASSDPQPKDSPSPPSPPTSAAAAQKAPAPAEKGLNTRFTDPNLDVGKWLGRFEREKREVFRERDKIVAAMGLKAGEAVADIGAGTGAFTAALATAVGGGGRVYALDISQGFVTHLTKRVADEKLTQVTVKLSKPADITLPEASVDVAFVCDTYHHFEKPAEILATIKKALKPGGRLVVVDFHRIEGKTRAWLLKHVRAGQEVFAAEIVASGFTRQADPPHGYLTDNYMMVFTR